MTEKLRVGLIIGSLRKDSFTRKIAKAAMALAPEDLDCRIVEIGDLDIYNQDLDDQPPQSWQRFRGEIAKADGILFLTPEYNRSIPGCLKNAIDVGSRPQGQNGWNGKPAGIISVTPYKLGAFGANHALRQALVFINVPTMQQPEAYIGSAQDLLAADGTLKDESSKTFLEKFMQALARWVKTNASQDGGAPPFGKFLVDAREKAASAYVRGDAKLLDAMVVTEGDATFFHPQGEIVTGAGAVKQRYDGDARVFGADGKSRLEILLQGESGDLAFWAGMQEAQAEIGGKSQSMTLRITEIFCRHADRWLLIHRHADRPARPE